MIFKGSFKAILLAIACTVFITACGGSDGGSSNNDGSDSSDSINNGGGAGGSNMARFTFDCDLQGVNANMTMDVEAVGTTGLVFGPGANPDITGVIGTGDYNLFTSGEVVSPVARYIFTGTNQFADFTETTRFERFRVEWLSRDDGLIMVVNPFGPGPAQHFCLLTGTTLL